MAGFSTPTGRAAFDITDPVRPLVVVAIGPLANYDVVPDDVAERDSAPRKRLPEEIGAQLAGTARNVNGSAGSNFELASPA